MVEHSVLKSFPLLLSTSTYLLERGGHSLRSSGRLYLHLIHYTVSYYYFFFLEGGVHILSPASIWCRNLQWWLPNSPLSYCREPWWLPDVGECLLLLNVIYNIGEKKGPNIKSHFLLGVQMYLFCPMVTSRTWETAISGFLCDAGQAHD